MRTRRIRLFSKQLEQKTFELPAGKYGHGDRNRIRATGHVHRRFVIKYAKSEGDFNNMILLENWI